MVFDNRLHMFTILPFNETKNEHGRTILINICCHLFTGFPFEISIELANRSRTSPPDMRLSNVSWKQIFPFVSISNAVSRVSLL